MGYSLVKMFHGGQIGAFQKKKKKKKKKKKMTQILSQSLSSYNNDVCRFC